MSTVNDIISELHAGEQAKAKVPELERALNAVSSERDSSQQHAQSLELKISNYRDQIDGLLSKVRALEVERDDAGFRELETADKLSTLLKAVRHATSDLDGSAMQVDPPKAPEKQPEPVKEPSAERPISAPEAGTSSQSNAASGGAEASPVAPSTGQSEPDPTASGTVNETSGNQSAQSIPSGAPSTDAPSSDTSPAVDTRPWWEKDAEARANPHDRNDSWYSSSPAHEWSDYRQAWLTKPI